MKNNECCEVVIVGAAHTDLQLYPVGADVLDTASYSVKQMVLTVGGDALNEATVITRLGHKVRLVSCVGDDVIGSLVLEALPKEQHRNRIHQGGQQQGHFHQCRSYKGGWRADIY